MGEAASAPQLTGREWLSRPQKHIWVGILGRARDPCGDKQRAQPRARRARGGSQGRIFAGSSQTARDGHGCVCDQHHHNCTCWERISINPTILAGITSCALVHRRLVHVRVTPRAADWGWDRTCGQAGAAGAAAVPGESPTVVVQPRGSTGSTPPAPAAPGTHAP